MITYLKMTSGCKILIYTMDNTKSNIESINLLTMVTEK